MHVRFLINGLTIIVILSGLSSCRSKKQAVKEPAKVLTTQPKVNDSMLALIDPILAAKNVGSAMSYDADIDYKDKQQNISLSVEITAKRDAYIFLTAKAIGFVNVARIMIQPDSIRIIDLINRTYISASYRYMRNYSSAPLSFENIQNLVWANAAFDPQVGSVVDTSGKPMKLITALGDVLQYAFYDESRRTEHFVLAEPTRARNLVVRYLKLTEMDGLHYPKQIVINIEGEKNMECKFSISNFAATIHKDPQFVVPRTYKVLVY